METTKILSVCGSITKKESLVWLNKNILEHSFVAEANKPYAGYYGKDPEHRSPNSLFLCTDTYYTLEESLSIVRNSEICARNKVNVATALLSLQNKRYPAIRIKNFPDYENIVQLQQCFLKHGINFAKRVNKAGESLVTVNKCFCLEQFNDSLYLDRTEKNEGYISVPQDIIKYDFDLLINNVRNNSTCLSFDAAKGNIIINGIITDIIRIYSEHLTVNLLNCIKKEVVKQIEYKWNLV